METNKNEYWEKFGIGYNVDAANRPADFNNDWADEVVSEWFDIYKRFLDEAENFLLRIGTEKIEIIEGYHKNILRKFVINFK